MSAGDGHKHLSDRHSGYPSSASHTQRKGNPNTGLHQHNPQPQSSRIQTHPNSYGIHFGQGGYGHHPANQIHPQPHSMTNNSHGHRNTPQNIVTQDYMVENHGSSQTRHQNQARMEEGHGENRQLPAYPEPPRYPGQRFERENQKEVKTQLDDDVGMHFRRSMKLEELREICQSQANDMRILKEQLQRLTDDNQELRDLCCFLDDDRQKGRKLAREWQRFGRYTASVMRQEVSAYQNKLRELDTKQQELVKDNLELKELCLYLDEERNSASCAHCGHPLSLRDDGDGSSSSTNVDEPSPLPAQPVPTTHHHNSHLPLSRSSSREILLQDSLGNQRSAFNEQILSYIRSLEARVLLLETEKQTLSEELTKVGRVVPEGEGEVDDDLLGLPPPPPVTRPAAVAAAMRVLEVQEQLESPPPPPPPPPPPSNHAPMQNPHSSLNQQMHHHNVPSYPGTHYSVQQDSALADGEKAILRQMCNVVWRKLEEVPAEHR